MTNFHIYPDIHKSMLVLTEFLDFSEIQKYAYENHN